MTIKEIVRSAAYMLGKTDVVSHLDGNTNVGSETLQSTSLLANLCTLVLDELSSTYLPMVKKETVSSSSGKYPFNQFREKVIKVVAVYNMDGEKIDFSLDEHYVLTNASKCTIEYEYAPKNYTLEDTIGYSEMDVAVSILAYGVAAEYSISQELFEQAVMYHKRYVDAIAEICLPKNKKIKARSWV